MPKPELIIATKRSLALRELQTAIDKEGFLVPLLLDAAQSPDSGVLRGTLGGAAISFGFREIPLSDTGVKPGMLAGYGHAFATPQSGDFRALAAGGMVLVGYARDGVGALVSSGAIESYPFPEFSKTIDAVLAAEFGKASEFAVRYPEDAKVSGPTTITVKVH